MDGTSSVAGTDLFKAARKAMTGEEGNSPDPARKEQAVPDDSLTSSESTRSSNHEQQTTPSRNTTQPKNRPEMKLLFPTLSPEGVATGPDDEEHTSQNEHHVNSASPAPKSGGGCPEDSLAEFQSHIDDAAKKGLRARSVGCEEEDDDDDGEDESDLEAAAASIRDLLQQAIDAQREIVAAQQKVMDRLLKLEEKVDKL